jgi:hypothetical protein
LVFAKDAHARDIHFCTSQQHFPENFWNPAFQQHRNGATGVAGVVMVAETPAEHRYFLESYTGAAATAVEGGLTIATPRGTVDVVTPDAFVQRFGVKAPPTARGARLAALRVTVAEAGLMQAVPELAGLGGLYAGNAAVVGMEDAGGAVLVFEPIR